MNRAPTPEVMDINGRPVDLDDLIGQGGEGAVYGVTANPRTLAKVYHNSISAEKAEKINIMSRMRNAELIKLTAWPSGLLLRRHDREPIGLLIPRVSNRKDIHHLYSPKSRRADFARADWRFLIRAATNTARAFAAVHEIGCVIGDVNHGGVLVAQDATVSLIDCDSFQVIAGARQFLCEVGVPTFTPPELQGKSFKGIVRTPNADNFGLAVMTFLLLFMGRHPFSGRYKGPGDMPIEKAIQESRFAYGALRADVNMERPPGTPPLSIVGDEVATLFERAFAAKAASGGRPTAREWITGLVNLEKSAKQCQSSQSHWYASHLGSCPWCAMEAATGIILFPFVVQHSPGIAVDVETLWKKIEAMQWSGPPPDIPRPIANPSAKALAFVKPPALTPAPSPNLAPAFVAAITTFAAAGLYLRDWALGVLASIGAYILIKYAIETKARKAHEKIRAAELEKLHAAEVEIATFKTIRDDTATAERLAREQWSRRTDSGEFNNARQKASKIYSSWKDLPQTRIKRLAQLQNDQRQLQLDKFLDRFKIVDAKIPGIGPGRKQTLESYGIFNAGDVTEARLNTIPGFGPVFQNKMLSWKKFLEAKFVFDPNKAIDAADIAKIEQSILSERKGFENQMQSAYADVVRIQEKLESVRKTMRASVEVAALAAAQAEVDYLHVSS
jgi:DNA-binding helix-hairpin-helix protein with protein kinase domain